MKCDICGVPLDKFEGKSTFNCGGTCLLCMAKSGDSDCIRGIEQNRTRFVERDFAYYCYLGFGAKHFWSFRVNQENGAWEFVTEEFMASRANIEYVDDRIEALKRA